jgi:site-specific DNA recombinase
MTFLIDWCAYPRAAELPGRMIDSSDDPFEKEAGRSVGIAFYCRVSSEEQRERGTIATQAVAAEAYRTLHQLPPFETYADEGVSGTIALGDRPAGARLLQDARAGKVSAVVVYKLDRLGRDPRHILNAIAELDTYDVAVRSMTEPLDTTTPAGRFLITILSGVAGLERDTFLEKSREGTNRLAREGAWLGGIVPYGYRKEGERQLGRLVIADEPIPGLGISEADVVRLIYRLAADDCKSCFVIAAQLNALGVPTRYTIDGRKISRGKRKEATANHWSPGRIRNMIVSTTYKGLHQFGKRSTRQRETIERSVPAIIDEQQWDRAQQTLRRNMIFSKRTSRRQYLLRGLMKCVHCGHTYIGSVAKGSQEERWRWYKCGGRHNRGRAAGLVCESKSFPAELVEQAIWTDVEGFLRHPGNVLDQLRQQQKDELERADELIAEIGRAERAIDAKQDERDTVLTLYRKGRIDNDSLDRQLDAIHQEESFLKQQVEGIRARLRAAEERNEHFNYADALLRTLNERLAGPLDWNTRRQLIETLVERITVQTVEQNGRRSVNIIARYRFTIGATANYTGTDSSPPPA